MKQRPVAKAETSSTANPLWIIAVAMAIFFGAAGVLIALG
jgi:hypothetical protein